MKHSSVDIHREIKLLCKQKNCRTCYKCAGKRVCDFVAALLLLVILSPFLLAIIIALLLFQGGNPFFCQVRIGRNCIPFHIIKFRTMRNTRDAQGKLLPDELRTTWIGKLLRATSIDELPELINVLKGDMSFIGPRPWIPEQMNTFDSYTRRLRMRIRPGISGLAQVHGRNNLTFRQRVAFDLRYARKLSLCLDVHIVLLTIWKIIKSEGIPQCPDALPLLPKDPHTKGARSNKPKTNAEFS